MFVMFAMYVFVTIINYCTLVGSASSTYCIYFLKNKNYNLLRMQRFIIAFEILNVLQYNSGLRRVKRIAYLIAKPNTKFLLLFTSFNN